MKIQGRIWILGIVILVAVSIFFFWPGREETSKEIMAEVTPAKEETVWSTPPGNKTPKVTIPPTTSPTTRKKCDFSKSITLRETTKYGIFGDDTFDTVVCGYLELKEVEVWGKLQTNAYFVIVDFLHEGFRRSLERVINEGNTVNIKENGHLLFNLGCYCSSQIISDEAEIDSDTQMAILNASKEKPVSIVLSFEEHGGKGCQYCNLAEKVSLY